MARTEFRQNGEEWGPWVVHDGKGCPVLPGTIVEVVFEDGFGLASRDIAMATGGSYSSWNWTHYPELKRIIRYREKKPRGMTALDSILREVDAPKEKRPVDAL